MASGYLCLFLFAGLLAAAVNGQGTAESPLVAHAHVAIDLQPVVGHLAEHLAGNVLTSGAASVPSGIDDINYSPSTTSDQTGSNQIVVWSSDPSSSWKFKEPSSWSPSKATTVSPTEPAATGDLATTLSSGTGGGSETTASADTTPSPGEVTTTETAPATTAAAAAETSLTTESPTTAEEGETTATTTTTEASATVSLQPGGAPAAQADTTTTTSPETTSSTPTAAEPGTGTGTTEATPTTTGVDRSEIPGTVEAQAKVRAYMIADGYNNSFIDTVLQKWPLTTGKIYREAQAKVRAQIQARTQTQPPTQVETTAAPTPAPTTTTPTPPTTRPPYQPPSNPYPGYNVNQYGFPDYNQPAVNKYPPPTYDWTKYNAPQTNSQSGYQQPGWPSSSGSQTQYQQPNTQVKYPQTQERQQPSWTQTYNPPAQTQTPQFRPSVQQQNTQNTWKPSNQQTYFQNRYPAYNTYTQQNTAQKTAYNPPTRGIMSPSSGTPPGVDPSKIRYFGQPGTQKPAVQPGPAYNKPSNNAYQNYQNFQNSQRYQAPMPRPGPTNTRRQQTAQQGETNEQVAMKVMSALRLGDLSPRMLSMMLPKRLQNSALARTMMINPDAIADLAESPMGLGAIVGMLQ